MSHELFHAKKARRFGRGLGLLSVALVLVGCDGAGFGLSSLGLSSPPSAAPPAASTDSDDTAIRHQIVSAWQQDHAGMAFVPDIAVSDGIVSLKGSLSAPQMRVDLVREAWQPGGVHEVIDELNVPASADSTYAKDTALSVRLRARLTFDPDIQSTRYSIESVSGVIYLMGIAQSQDEMAKVKKLAGNVGATRVVSYVRVADSAMEPARS